MTAAKTAMDTNPKTIKTLSQREECLVLHFESRELRDEAWTFLWREIYETDPSHYEKRRGNSKGGINYASRGFASGEFLIVKAPTLCSDTWHSVEHKKLRASDRLRGNKGDYDIDRVQYHEVVSASSEDSLSPEQRAEEEERNHIKEEARQRAEAQRREAELERKNELERQRAAEDRKKAIQSERKQARVCTMCGKKLGLIQRIFGAQNHKECTAFREQ